MEANGPIAINGISGEAWEEHRVEIKDIMQKTDSMHTMMSQLLQNTQPISTKLDAVVDAIKDMKVGLMDAATGRDQIPTNVAMYVLKVLGWVIFGLMIVIVFLLTGSHFGWIGQLHQ